MRKERTHKCSLRHLCPGFDSWFYRTHPHAPLRVTDSRVAIGYGPLLTGRVSGSVKIFKAMVGVDQ
jgi:hypothetical protein